MQQNMIQKPKKTMNTFMLFRKYIQPYIKLLFPAASQCSRRQSGLIKDIYYGNPILREELKKIWEILDQIKKGNQFTGQTEESILNSAKEISIRAIPTDPIIISKLTEKSMKEVTPSEKARMKKNKKMLELSNQKLQASREQRKQQKQKKETYHDNLNFTWPSPPYTSSPEQIFSSPSTFSGLLGTPNMIQTPMSSFESPQEVPFFTWSQDSTLQFTENFISLPNEINSVVNLDTSFEFLFNTPIAFQSNSDWDQIVDMSEQIQIPDFSKEITALIDSYMIPLEF
ncbi:hypothetical protein HK096_001566 [Nowakowskiella sp. JEL0078]|nr:hypothetical protein HK096_001566 [Nowakowskiella sp. JEL0078]